MSNILSNNLRGNDLINLRTTLKRMVEVINYNEGYEEAESFTIDDWYEMRDNLTRDIFAKINNKQKITFTLINSDLYHRALKEFMEHGMFLRFPENQLFKWKELLLYNIAKLEVLTSISGHSQYFPFDEFHDEFDHNDKTGDDRGGEFTMWRKQRYKKTKDDDYLKEYDWGVASEFLDTVKNWDDYLPLFSNGQWVLSDYGLEPLLKLGETLIDANTGEEIIVLMNRILDVAHQRSDLAELFITGGSASLSRISNSLDELKRSLVVKRVI